MPPFTDLSLHLSFSSPLKMKHECQLPFGDHLLHARPLRCASFSQQPCENSYHAYDRGGEMEGNGLSTVTRAASGRVGTGT